MAKQRNRMVDYLVYAVIRLIVGVLQALPMSVGYFVADLIAHLAHAVDRRHRRVALENLRVAFGDTLDEAARKQMVRRVYQHFARMIVEMTWIPRKLHIHNWKRYARLDGAHSTVERLLDKNRPLIIVTGHFGNWEMAGFLVAALGVKSHAIARDLDNPFLHDFVLRFRQWTGQTIFSKTGDYDKIEAVLANKGVLITVGDQSAGPKGYFVDFFGRPASTHKAIAILAVKFDAPVVVGWAYRDRNGFHYRIGCSPVLDPRDYAEIPNGAQRLTQDFTGLLETAVRLAPEQYLWLHQRWKHQSPIRKCQPAMPAAQAA